MQIKHWLLLGSLGFFLASLLLLPAILILMPADYFSRDSVAAVSLLRNRPLIRAGFLVMKNVSGLILFATGLLMLFTPGQGILGILGGLWLLDFPGKRALERRLVGRPGVLRMLNAIRVRLGRPPFERPMP
jgi:hypothetical protein